ncbi:hypothetical protein B0H15DRAFT_866129 [Mycena belliarum]|uniref:Uncharacterized protein n=1 Tax=Mycena belliarum TaxID=1033014 RepID=A0AAD6TSP5_9AGAR|nr:hypothetical protein B0H15DRAFT_866129 [Mycena belliae]
MEYVVSRNSLLCRSQEDRASRSSPLCCAFRRDVFQKSVHGYRRTTHFTYRHFRVLPPRLAHCSRPVRALSSVSCQIANHLLLGLWIFSEGADVLACADIRLVCCSQLLGVLDEAGKFADAYRHIVSVTSRFILHPRPLGGRQGVEVVSFESMRRSSTIRP